MSKPSKTAETLAKFLTYALGRRPDEFGLVTDSRGYISLKALVQALRQEDGWGHLRPAHINEVALTVIPCPVEIENDHIRARERDQLPAAIIPRDLPKLLYIPIRRKAHPTVLEKGLRSGSRPHLVLSSDREMALKLGRRIDNEPVILTVQVSQSLDKGVDFKQYGDTLFLTDNIPAGTFSGPPLPKEKPTTGKPAKPRPVDRNPTPGSYFPDFFAESEPLSSSVRAKRRKKETEWKKARKQARRHKSRQQDG